MQSGLFSGSKVETSRILRKKIAMDTISIPQKKSGSSNISSNQTLTDTKCPSKTDNQIGDQSRRRGIRKRRKGGHVNSIVSIWGRHGAGEAQNTNRPESHTVDNRFEDVPKTKVEIIREASKGPFLGT